MYAAFIEPFSFMWWKVSVSALGLGVVLLLMTIYLPKNIRKVFASCLGIFLLLDIVVFDWMLYSMGSWSIQWALPLQYCTIMEICAAVVLLTRWQWLYEVVLFLGMVGPVQALITPAFPYAGDYFFYEFYISHMAPIFVPFFLTVVEKMRPRGQAWWKSVVGFTVFAWAIFGFNSLTHSNYMFLMQKPPVRHPLIEIGVWPDYLFFWWFFLLGWSGMIQLIMLCLKNILAKRSISL